MTKPNTTLISVLLDCSGSMARTANDTIGGFNNFLSEQKKGTDEAHMTFAQFNSDYKIAFNGMPLSVVPDLTADTYRCGGNTALLDALGRTIDDIGAKLSALSESERPESVVVVVITDGEENSSKEYTKDRIAEMVKTQTDVYNWQFLFLGANIDAIQNGGAVGVAQTKSMNYQVHNPAEMFKAVSANMTSYRSTKSADDLNFTAAQRLANSVIGVVPPPALTGVADLSIDLKLLVK